MTGIKLILILIGMFCTIIPVFYLLSNLLIWSYLTTIDQKKIHFIQVVKKYKQGSIPLTVALSMTFSIVLFLNLASKVF